jgi:hypothetical protein
MMQKTKAYTRQEAQTFPRLLYSDDPSSYEIRKHGEGLIALWGTGLHKPKDSGSKLLSSKAPSRKPAVASKAEKQANSARATGRVAAS